MAVALNDPSLRAGLRRPVHRVAVLGLGRTGLSVVRHLVRLGVDLAITDSRDEPPGREALADLPPGTRVHLGGFDAAVLDHADEVIVSPGISLEEPIVRAATARGLPLIGDIELFARASGAPVVGITGTNGKSTVTSLVAAMGRAAGRTLLAGGNLGPPALDLLTAPVPDVYVLELSSFQLDTTQSLVTRAATVLNVTADHMDRYSSLEQYAASKAHLFDGCQVAVINRDDPLVRRMPREGQPVIGFSLRADAEALFHACRDRSDIILNRGDERLVAMSELRVKGAHNAANALAALALGQALDWPMDACVAALRGYTGLPHRTQWVADVAGVRYVDDSKGTNVGATLAAVAGMPGPLLVIAGGDGKGQDFAPLAAAFAGKVRHAILIGRDAGRLRAVLEPACACALAPDMQSAVRAAARLAVPGDTVLLSPACASFDMFRDYAHRGDEFAAAVRRLA
jgi:UDP-N-acetylmuramoylalanine--D-glutamate ligase